MIANKDVQCLCCTKIVGGLGCGILLCDDCQKVEDNKVIRQRAERRHVAGLIIDGKRFYIVGFAPQDKTIIDTVYIPSTFNHVAFAEDGARRAKNQHGGECFTEIFNYSRMSKAWLIKHCGAIESELTT